MRLALIRTIAIAPAAIAAASLGACANLESFSIGELPVPEDSPVAVAVRDAARDPGPFPTFAAIPDARRSEQDLTRRAEERANLDRLVLEMQAIAAALPPVDSSDIEAFAAEARATFDGIEPPPADATAEIEAFARAARARATPPPPPS
jgi:hypothetical protein